MTWTNLLSKGILASILAVGSCTPSTQEIVQDGPHKNWEQLVAANNSLAVDLYGRLAGDTDSNLLISPYSAVSALTLAYQGADGATREEMARVLHLPSDQTQAMNGLLALGSALKTNGGDTELISTNTAWIDNIVPLLPAFEQAMGSSGELRRIDFSNTRVAVTQINSVVEQATRGMIRDLLSDDSVSADTQLALVNALYLKAKWEKPFKAEQTRPQDFYLQSGETVETQFMHQTADFPLYTSDSYDAVELPYKRSAHDDTALVMRLYLPHDASKLGVLEKEVLGEQIGQTSVAPWPLRKVDLWMPKFEMDYSASLADTLKNLGMKQAFSVAKADFSKITEQGKLAIDEVLQKTKVKVDEAGTEAAAATAVVIARTSVDFEEYPYFFEADHPFLFTIQDKSTGTVLFIGRLMQP